MTMSYRASFLFITYIMKLNSFDFFEQVVSYDLCGCKDIDTQIRENGCKLQQEI